MMLSLDYNLLLVIQILSFFLYPLLSTATPLLITIWFQGCILLFAFGLGLIFPAKRLRLALAFASGKTKSLFSANNIQFAFWLGAICIFVLTLTSNINIDGMDSLTAKQYTSSFAVVNPFYRYTAYLRQSYSLLFLLYIEQRSFYYFSTKPAVVTLLALSRYLYYLRMPIFIILMQSYSLSKSGLAGGLLPIFLVISYHASLWIVLLLGVLLLCLLIYSFWLFFAFSFADQEIMFTFTSISQSLFLRLIGTSFDALNAINTISLKNQLIDYPFHSFFYYLGPLYVKTRDSYIGPGGWLELTAFGSSWGGGPNPTFIGDFIIASPLISSIPILYFLGLSLKQAHKTIFPVTISYVIYQSLVDLHGIEVSLLVCVFNLTLSYLILSVIQYSRL